MLNSPLSLVAKSTLVITKKPPNSAIQSEPCPPGGDMMKSISAPEVPPMSDANTLA